jgi:Domain of unknown function (DUF222)
MQDDILDALKRLTDSELIAGVKSLVARDRDATARIIAHLAELDTRDVHLREGYRSLFVYCRDALGLSEGEAYNRIEVARAAREYPMILEMLAEGSVHLTAVRLLAPHLTSSNHRDVLASARGKRKAQIEEIIAALAPRPDVRTSIRPLPMAGGEPPSAPPSGLSSPTTPSSLDVSTQSEGTSDAVAQVAHQAPVLKSPTLPPPAAVTPLSPDRYKLQVTISGDTLAKLRRAKDMLARRSLWRRGHRPGPGPRSPLGRAG